MFSASKFRILLAILCAVSMHSAAGFGQDILTKGAISGRILDTTGAVIPGAMITVSGPTGDRTTTTNSSGDFEVSNLLPGQYSVKAEKQGFKTVSAQGLEVNVGKTAALRLTLEVGTVEAVVAVVATETTAVDLSSTAVGANLNDQLLQTLPLRRAVSSLFYLAAGVTDGLGAGTANPSISGGSPLDNLYVADGVNITDAAFGGFGVFTRSYGALGTGINASFVKEVQIKTGGFEPQYGQSQGGIVNIVTKSGGNQVHGAVFGFSTPHFFEATRLQPDVLRTNKNGETIHQENYDAGAEIGGPIVKDKLFFFGLYNPSARRDLVRGAVGSGLLNLYGNQTHERYLTNSYSLKIDANLSKMHQFNFSFFGDPTKTNVAPFSSLVIDNLTANSLLDYGTRNASLRYTGTMSPTWTVLGAVSQSHNRFSETGYANLNWIRDETQTQAGGRGRFIAVGRGFVEPYSEYTYRATLDTTKYVQFLGTHTFGVGYQYQRGLYTGVRDRSGLHAAIPFTNVDGTYTVPAKAAGQITNAQFRLRLAPSSCTLCPLMTVPGNGDKRVYLQTYRGEFGGAGFDTYSRYHDGYVQDSWHLNKYVTAIGGLRWEQERLIGAPGATTGTRLKYSFTGQWSPRIGVTVDPFGTGTTKVYYNFGRFHEYIPLDLAERSLSSEKDFTGADWLPDYTVAGGSRRVVINQYGTVNPVLDAAHLINRAVGGINAGASVSAQDPVNPILPGTKLAYSDEHVVGFEHQLPHGLLLSVRYMDRRMKRIVEDASVEPVDDGGLFGQAYFIGNISSKTDAGVNPISHKFPADGTPPAICDPNLVNPEVTDSFGNIVGGVCYETNGKNGRPAGDPGADGIPDGFVNPVHIYRAVEIEINKRFSENWQLLSNWRIGSLRGNFEGHFRNDNGQADPAISSLFDFTPGDYGLLADQFAVGPLPTDRRHVVNIYGSYAFAGRTTNWWRGLMVSPGIHMESGIPISELLAHPVYLNPGEVPLGGRGKLGRTAFTPRFDLQGELPIHTSEKTILKVNAAFLNLFNTQHVRLPDQNRQISAGTDNVDFLTPLSYYVPFSARLGLRFEF
jgi:hypothetical protein